MLQLKCLMIRHAQSEFNKAQQEFNRKTRGIDKEPQWYDEDFELKFSETLVDAPISKLGFRQCEIAKNQLISQNIAVVFCSPLQRSVQTAHLLFQDHPNRPKIICLGYLRENLYSACDVGTDLEFLQEKYPEVDINYVKKDLKSLWVLDYLVDRKQHDMTLKAIQFHDVKNSIESLLHIMKNKFINEPQMIKNLKLFESGEHSLEKAKRGKQEIFNYLQQQNLIEELTKSEKKIAVVGHFWQMNYMFSESFTEDGTPSQIIGLDNCEQVEIDINF